MTAQLLEAADEQELNLQMRIHEAAMNRQLGVTLFFAGIAYFLCLFCCWTNVFLVGNTVGTLAFLPGGILLFIGAGIARFFNGTDNSPRWVKYTLMLLLFVSILDLALVQLVWCLPLIVGGAAFVYAYRNMRLTAISNTLILLALPVSATINALWGMPNPDMLPYPASISGIPDGYVTLWAMENRDQWDTWVYFVRVLRFHTLPVLFLMLIITSCGVAMTRRAKDRMRRTLASARRIREIEACLLLMAGGAQSQEVIMAVLGADSLTTAPVPPLSKEFVESIRPEDIPAMMREFRHRCRKDAKFADLAEKDPEAALRQLG